MRRGDRSECRKREEKTHVRLEGSRQVEGYGAGEGTERELESAVEEVGKELGSVGEEQQAAEEAHWKPAGEEEVVVEEKGIVGVVGLRFRAKNHWTSLRRRSDVRRMEMQREKTMCWMVVMGGL